MFAGGGVGTHELHFGVLGLERTQRVGHDLVGNVPFEIDEEAVVAQATTRGPGLELGEVDAASRELLKDRQQLTGFVGALEHDD